MTSDKDLYLDNSSVEEASGVYPIDDDDYSSGSGSGETTCHNLIFKGVRGNAIEEKLCSFPYELELILSVSVMSACLFIYRALNTPAGLVLKT